MAGRFETVGAAVAVLRRDDATLATLVLRTDGQIGDAAAAALADAVKVSTTLTTLDLGFNDILAGGAAALADAVTVNTTLTALNLRGCSLGDAGAAVLAKAVTTLTELDLRGNRMIGDPGAAALAEAVKHAEGAGPHHQQH